MKGKVLRKLIGSEHFAILLLLLVFFSEVPAISEQVSGNTVEFEMTSLAPATEYTVNVHAIRNREKSAPATTDFTTGEMQS